MLSHWLKTLFVHSAIRLNKRSRKKFRRNTQQNVPKIGITELLEDRTLLSTITVDTLMDENDGVGTGGVSLRDAIAAANSAGGDDIVFSVTGTINLTNGELSINKSLTINGQSNNITVDAGGNSRVFFVDGNVDVTLSNLTISGGSASGSGSGSGGGALLSSSSGSLTVQNSTVTGNSASNDGGGLYSSGSGTLNVYESVIRNNNAGTASGNVGGGIGASGGTLNVRASEISGNTAFRTGGIFSYAVTTVSDSIIDSNLTTETAGGGFGGGISSGNNLTLLNSTVSNNRNFGSTGGGGVRVGSGTARIENSTISRNQAKTGGGIVFQSGTLTVVNSTITGNSATDTGGGVQIGMSANATFHNTIIAGNTSAMAASDIDGTVTTANNNLIGDANTAGGITHGMNGNIVGNMGTGTLDVNTVLNTTLANNGGSKKTHALVSGSPAINAGDNTLAVNSMSNALTTDQRGTGFARILGSNVDIGAFEFPQSPLIASGAGPGGGPNVVVRNAETGQVVMNFFAYDSAFTGGVRVAMGDVNNDGIDDIITAPGRGGGPNIRVFDGSNGNQLSGTIGSFLAYDAAFTGGVYVATADFNNDGFDDIITGADTDGGPHVKVFNGNTGAEMASFFAYDFAFTGGVRVAAGDLNGDNTPDIITGAGPGGGPHVRVFDGSSLPQSVMGNAQTNVANLTHPLGNFFPYAAGFEGGVYVSAGLITGDNRVDLVTGAGEGGGPHVRVFDGAASVETEVTSFFPFAGFTGGVRVATGDVNGDNVDEVIVGAGPGGGPNVAIFNGNTGSVLSGANNNFFPFSTEFGGGVFVSGATRSLSGSPLRIDGGSPRPESVNELSYSDLQPIYTAAIDRLGNLGLSTTSLSNLNLEITDLPDDLLGLAWGQTIQIDINAAGYGWFVDSTPNLDEEFDPGTLKGTTADSLGGVDLLTTLLHELSHHLGADHVDDPTHLLAETLAPGQRRLLSPEDLDRLFSEDVLLDSILN
ncbi:MAG: VCBS repeat-containing protein [Planctomycetaceae bacterium]|nr:VCBS repeat-containing protein [Planctomycetaceae bacterium]